MSEYSVQELLDLLDVTEPEKAPDHLLEDPSPISKFIREFKVHSGVDRIPTHVLYYTYKEKFRGELSKIEFFRHFKKEFTQRRTGKQRVYLLDAESFDMTREGIIEAEYHNKRK